MDNKELIETVITAFDKSDVEAILAHVTEDVQWDMVGDLVISGKESLREFFQQNPDMEMIGSTKNHFILNGDVAAVDGVVTCKHKNGNTIKMSYCDIYEIENGKVKKMISYIVNEKKPASSE